MNLLPCFAAMRLENVQRPWLWAIMLLGGVALLYYTYLEIFQRTEKRLTWALLGLRGAGLFLLLLALAKPTWTRESEQVDPGRVAIVLDTSRSMSLADPSGKSTRYAKARLAVDRLSTALTSGAKGTRLAVDVFDINGAALKTGMPESPLAGRTDLLRAVKEATGKLRGQLLTGVVVVSDGIDNTGRTGFADLEDQSVPVHGLGFPFSQSADLDLGVAKPQAPERTIIHNELRVAIPVSKTGPAAANGTVSLKRGKEVLASQKVTFAEGKAEQTVTLSYTPKEAGTFLLTVAVEAETGERDVSNNAVNFPLRVDNEPIGVMYVEGFLRNEYKFLKARLEDDPDLALVSVVRLISPDRPEGRTGRDLFLPDRMKKIDVVILGDMEGKYLTAAEYANLLKWLDGKNHSLLLLGGEVSFGADGFRNTPLAEALPVVFAAGPPFQSYDTFGLQLTEKGQGHPIFTLSSDRIKDAATWAEAPPLSGMGIVQRTKPGAEELAVNPKLMTIDGKPAPVLVVQRAPGGGQVLVFTADTTWRWSRLARVMGQSDTLYARFWSQTIRWLAGRNMDDQRPLLTLGTKRPDYDVGERVKITVNRQPRPDVNLSKADLRIEVITPSGNSTPLDAIPDSTNLDQFTADYIPSGGGRFEVRAEMRVGGQAIANQSAEFLVQGPDLELANTGTNPAALRAMAEATGGVYFDMEQVDELAEKIARKERKTQIVKRTEYWNSPFLFAAFILALSTEWFLRRMYHLI